MTNRGIGWLTVIAWVGVALTACNQSPSAADALEPESASGGAQIRLNQVGYAPVESKVAVLMTSQALTGQPFRVLNVAGKTVLSGVSGRDQGAWNVRYSHTYPLEFSRVRQPGRYTIVVDGSAGSVSFPVDAPEQLYEPLLNNAWFFFEAQKDGPKVNAGVMNRQPSHLSDANAMVYKPVVYDQNGVLATDPLEPIGTGIDVSGGWSDAGDYLKFTQTTSYTVAALLFAAREYPDALRRPGRDLTDTGRYGLAWLQKMWNDRSRTLYLQVGIGDGNGSSILGDHDFWRLPQADDALKAKPSDPNYFVQHRPVFRANQPGQKISPNLAGRVAASFALCAQLWRDRTCLREAEHVYALADTNPGELVTALPHDFYPESEWRDDLELGAIELARAEMTLGGNASAYLEDAKRWARAYAARPDHEPLGVYNVGALAHFELVQTLRALGAGGDPVVKLVLNDLENDLNRAQTQAASDPFNFGVKYGQFDAASNAIGLAVSANLYDRLVRRDGYSLEAPSGEPRTQGLEAQTSGSNLKLGALERDWLLGRNAWGVSLVIGAGTTFTRCPQHQIANLTGQTLLGGVVNGPNSRTPFADINLTDFSFVNRCELKPDPYTAWNSSSTIFVDNANAWPTVEPAIDYTVGSVILFAQEVSAGER